MRLQLLLPALLLFAASPGAAQAPVLDLDTTLATDLAWGEDDMGLSAVIAIRNRSGEEVRAVVPNAMLFSAPGAVDAGPIIQNNCGPRTDMVGQAVPGHGASQIKMGFKTGVEELGPHEDVKPVLLVCANYQVAGEHHKSAVWYRLLHIDPVRGVLPIDRANSDVSVQFLKLEELGRYAD